MKRYTTNLGNRQMHLYDIQELCCWEGEMAWPPSSLLSDRLGIEVSVEQNLCSPHLTLLIPWYPRHNASQCRSVW